MAHSMTTEGRIMYKWLPWEYSTVPRLSLPVEIEELGHMSETSLAGSVGSGSAPNMGGNMVRNSTFLKKQWFLRVILPDPSILIHYLCSGMTVMFHQQFSWFCIATLSPFWRGWILWLYLLYFFIIQELHWWRLASWHCAAIAHSGCSW